MKAVAKEMEAMFAHEMIKVMRETSGKAAKGSLGNDTYMSMFDLEISKLFAERGLGLQPMFERGIKQASEKAGQHHTPKPATLQATAGETAAPGSAEKALLPDSTRSRVSSGFGARQDPFTGEPAFHHGLDIAAKEGAEVHPVRKGTVVFSGEKGGLGNVVIIDHGDGFQTKYAHNLANLVQQGQAVDTGSVIAQVGSTGRSTGSHLHFEVSYNGKLVAPDTLLSEG